MSIFMKMKFNHNLQITKPNRISNIKNLHSDQAPNDVWELFYENSPKSVVISGNNARIMSRENECFLYNCIFIDIKTNYSAIYFDYWNNKFLSSDCSFNNCSSRKFSGSIYFKCESSIIQYRTCGYKSKTNDAWGHHSYIYLAPKSNEKNYLYESSFYECGNLKNSATNYLACGNIEVKTINTSFCKAKEESGISLASPTSLCNVTYSSFCNTTSKYRILE